LEHAKEILKSMLECDLTLDSWHAYLDPKGIDEEFMELILETHGWRQPSASHPSFFFPLDVESGSSRMLKKLRKTYDLSDVVASVECFRRVAGRYEKRSTIDSIQLGLHFLLGYPGEDEETIRETCQFIREVKPSQVAFQAGVRIYPQTILAEETKGIAWGKASDLVKPTFADIHRPDLMGWLRKYLDSEYRAIVQKGNMIVLNRDLS
jgi:tRNA A37 methylthiotransferase MiaB